MDKEFIEGLDSLLDSFGCENDERIDAISDEDFKKSIIESENKLEEEYIKIEQIRIKSLNDARNDTEIYV